MSSTERRIDNNAPLRSEKRTDADNNALPPNIRSKHSTIELPSGGVMPCERSTEALSPRAISAFNAMPQAAPDASLTSEAVVKEATTSLPSTTTEEVHGAAANISAAAALAAEKTKQTAQSAAAGVSAAASSVAAAAAPALEKTKELGAAAVEQTKAAAQAVAEKTPAVLEKTKELASTAAEKTMEFGAAAIEQTKAAAHVVAEKTPEMLERAKELASSAVEHIKEAAHTVAERAGPFVEKAREVAEAALERVMEVAHNVGEKMGVVAASTSAAISEATELPLEQRPGYIRAQEQDEQFRLQAERDRAEFLGNNRWHAPLLVTPSEEGLEIVAQLEEGIDVSAELDALDLHLKATLKGKEGAHDRFFCETVHLPESSDILGINASFFEGILKVNVPKRGTVYNAPPVDVSALGKRKLNIFVV